METSARDRLLASMAAVLLRMVRSAEWPEAKELVGAHCRFVSGLTRDSNDREPDHLYPVKQYATEQLRWCVIRAPDVGERTQALTELIYRLAPTRDTSERADPLPPKYLPVGAGLRTAEKCPSNPDGTTHRYGDERHPNRCYWCGQTRESNERDGGADD